MTDSNPDAIASSPAGQRLARVLDAFRSKALDFSDAEYDETFVVTEIPPDWMKERLGIARHDIGDAKLLSLRSPDPQLAIAVVTRESRTWHVGVRIERDPPYRIKNVVRCEEIPGVRLRRATEADAAALREIEMRVPIVMGDTRVVYDRGHDYFAAERLMGDVLALVVERDGKPVGLSSSVIHRIRVMGNVWRGSYGHRLRVLPEARGEGLSMLLGFNGFESNSWRADYPYSFVAGGNTNMLKNVRSPWSVRPDRIVIDTAVQAGPTIGRPAMDADASRIVAMLNSAHEREELFVPYTAESLDTRLKRERQLYSWQNLRIGERAVVGVWPAHLNVIRTTSDIVDKQDRALVLDFGYESGGEDELIALLRAECAELTLGGTTELTIFTCEPSSVHAQLRSLAKRIEPYVLSLYLPEPGDLASRGIYVDQLYF